jgi:hypothetical protein
MTCDHLHPERQPKGDDSAGSLIAPVEVTRTVAERTECSFTQPRQWNA